MRVYLGAAALVVVIIAGGCASEPDDAAERSAEQRYLDRVLSESSAVDFEGSASEALEIGYLYCDLAEEDGWDSVIQDLNERADEAAQADAEWMRLSALGLIADVRSLLCPDVSTVDSSRSEGSSLTEAEREQICADAPENGPLWRAAACDRG